ncbi:MAG: DUF4126 family protein [Deltaproteobacteria bacterium]|nr:MAG: DUF4126 family protein [Deltaproteobacteria bacterium]
MDLMTILAAAGLGGAAGQRALLPALLLGLFHHTPWFALGESWTWLASPAVLVVLALLAVAEEVAGRSETVGPLADTAARVPRWIAGFAVAAVGTGALDADLAALLASGLIGVSAAVGAEQAHSRGRAETRALAEGGVEFPDRTLARIEVLAVAGLTASALLFPALILVVAVGALAAGRGVVLLGRRLRHAAIRVGGLSGVDETEPERPPASDRDRNRDRDPDHDRDPDNDRDGTAP